MGQVTKDHSLRGPRIKEDFYQLGIEGEDHPLHDVPMLGGMWGVQRTKSRKAWRDVWTDIWTDIIADPLSQDDRGKKGFDQELLSRHVWRKLSGEAMQWLTNRKGK